MAENHQNDHGETLNTNMQEMVERADEMARQIAAFQWEWAYRMWQVAGEQHGLAIDFWLAAQQYVESVTNALKDTAKRGSQSYEGLTQMRDALWDTQYFDRTRDLAYQMWVESGQLPGTTLAHYWRDASRHISAIVIGATKTAASAADIANVLAQVLADFSPSAHLKDVQKMAYLNWIGRGKPYWEPMEDWIEAENAALQLKAEGEAVRQKRR